MSNNAAELKQSQIQSMIADFRYEEQLKNILKEQFTQGQFEKLLQLSYSTDVLQKHKGIIGIRKLVSVNNNPPYEMVVNSGILPMLKELMTQQQFPQLKLQAAWIFTNIAAGTQLQCKTIVGLGVVPLFIGLLKQKNALIIQQALWGIGNISADSVAHRNDVINADGVKALIEVLQMSSSQSVVKHCAWALSSLCQRTPLPSKQVASVAIPPLCKLLAQRLIKDIDILCHVCWAISYHSQHKDILNVIVNSGVIPFLMQLLDQPGLNLKISAMRILGSVAASCQRHLLIAHGLFPKIDNLLSHKQLFFLKEVCCLISIMACGTMAQVDALITSESIIKKLVQFFGSLSDQIWSQLFIVFRNIGENGNPAQVFSLFKNYQIVRQIVQILDRQDLDLINTTLALECLKVILSNGFKQSNVPGNPFACQFKQFGGIEHLQRLKCHRSDAIYQQTCIIQEMLSMANE